jgi:hypothetical protein
MFAESAKDVPTVAARLMDDELIRGQGLVVRQYVPLQKLGEGINALPFTNEWRFFVMDGEILTGAFYWSTIDTEDLPFDPLVPPSEATALVQKAIQQCSGTLEHAFYVVDVAKDEQGRWWVVELNDGQMSGLSFNNPKTLYEGINRVGSRLAESLNLYW